MGNEIVKKGRGGKYNFPHTIDPDTIEAGTNTKFLQHALAVRNLPPIDSSDPVQVQERINEYFVICAEHDMKPTVSGFLSALRVSKTTLWEWKNGTLRAGTHQAIICEAYDVLETLWEGYMMNGKINPVSGIFLGKNNFGYKDQQEHILTPNTTMASATKEEIEAKYKELPEQL